MFKLDLNKAIESTGILIRLAPRCAMGRKRLLALLYLADRECLAQSGRPIVGGKLAAMKYGPINSEVNDLIKGSHSNQAAWSKYFANDAHLVVMSEGPEVAALSRREVGILNEVSDKYMGYDDWDVAEATHQFVEYKRSYTGNGSKQISFELLIEALGLNSRKESILEDAKEKEGLDQLFSPAHHQGAKSASLV